MLLRGLVCGYPRSGGGVVRGRMRVASLSRGVPGMTSLQGKGRRIGGRGGLEVSSRVIVSP